MSRIGFGTYRASIKSKEHYDALKYALESGCEVIDTSSNYTHGDSEALIGKVIDETKIKPLIITKVGYIQGETLENLNDKFQEDLVVINETLKHSIHPSFIANQLDQSLERLNVDCIDVYLLHNPEYYLKTKNADKTEYYARIQKAFLFLEEQVKAGKIKSYGISSNTFVDPKDELESTDLDKVYEIAESIGNHNFRYIQFPLNLIELGALERQFDGEHLIERAKSLNLITITNRPLNAFLDQGLLRLSNYEVDEKYTDAYAEHLFVEKVEALVKKWEQDKDDGDESLFEIPLFRQINEIWYKQNSIDAVDQIFHNHFFPFIASIWGTNLTPEESSPYYHLYEVACEYAKRNMNKRANQFKETAISQGLLFETDKDLSLMAIEKYFSFGVDIVLLGMRKVNYVDKVKSYFTA